MSGIDIPLIAAVAEAMIDQARCGDNLACRAQSYGCAIADGLGYDPYLREAANLADLAEALITDQRSGSGAGILTPEALVTRVITLAIDRDLTRKASRRELFLVAGDSGNLHLGGGISGAAGCNPIASAAGLLFTILGGGLMRLIMYPSRRGMVIRFLGGVTSAAVKAGKGKKA